MDPAPFTAIDVQTFVFSLLAVIFAGIWLRDRERGMGWMAVSMALAASWYAKSQQLPIRSPYMDTPALQGWGIVLGLGILLINFGVVRYLGSKERWLHVALGAFMLPGIGPAGAAGVARRRAAARVPRGHDVSLLWQRHGGVSPAHP
jgi:nitrate reductase gamma subunit